MSLKDIRQKPKNELVAALQDKREKLRELRFNLATGKVKNVSQVRKLKKEIARILTLLESTN